MTNASAPMVGGSGAEDPSLERSFRGHRDTVTGLVFHSNMKQLISGSSDGSVMIWNFKPAMRAFRFSGHKAAVHSVAYCPVTGLVASGSKDRTVRLWIPTVYGLPSSSSYSTFSPAVHERL